MIPDVPCINCICLSICKSLAKEICSMDQYIPYVRRTIASRCSLLNDYMRIYLDINDTHRERMKNVVYFFYPSQNVKVEKIE